MPDNSISIKVFLKMAESQRTHILISERSAKGRVTPAHFQLQNVTL